MDQFPIPAPEFNGRSRAVDAGNALEWLRQGWALFVASPAVWIAMTIILLVLIFALGIVPVIGALAVNLFTPLIAAGMLHVCQRLSNSETPVVGDLFIGFNRNPGALIMVGVLYMAAMFAIFVVVAFLGGGTAASGLAMGSPLGFVLAIGGVMFAGLLSLALFVPLAMAVWFAPALVFFNNMQPVDALKASFGACLKNILAFLIYGLIVMVLAFFAALPVGLGFLVLIPVLAGSLYASYRDIFVAN